MMRFKRWPLLLNAMVVTVGVLMAVAPAWAAQSPETCDVLQGRCTTCDSCTDIVVGKRASADGSVITSHTCDGWYDARLQVVPAQDHEPGTMAPVYEWIIEADQRPLVKLGEIPQVAHTYKYFNVAYPFANEYQVIIGETTIGGSRKTANSEQAIMTIEQLEVYALQRARTAREAIRIMGDLAVKYGYRESCDLGECLTVTDPNEAWVFEIFGVGPLWSPDSGKPGAVWAAQRLPADHITCVPNMSRIGEVDPVDADNFMVSPNYIDTAVQLGLYDPAAGKPFVWRDVYGDVQNSGLGSRLRLWRVYSLMAPSQQWDPYSAQNYPFSIKPEKKVSVQDVIAMFRDTYAGTRFDMTDDPDWFVRDRKGNWVKSPMATPQVGGDWRALLDIEYYRPIARYYCSYYFVSQARDWLPDPVGGLLWFGLDNPETGVFVPLYTGVDSVPDSWTRAERRHYDPSSAWWAFGLADDLVNLRYQELLPKLKAVRDPMEADLLAVQPAIEKAAVDLYHRDPVLARTFLTTYTGDVMRRFEHTYRDLVNQFLWELNNNRH